MDPNRSNGRGNLNGKIMLSAIVVLFAIVIIILFLHLYVRWHVLRRASRRTRRRRRLILAGEIQLPPASAPNCRLDPSILKSLPVVLFSSAADGADDGGGEELVECAVCLNEFEEGEKIRCLPRCRHGFHIDCIDMWFCSHSTCPLCRAEVEAVVIPSDDPPAVMGDPEEATGSTSSDAGGREVGIQVPAIEVVELLGLVCESREQQALKLSSCRFFLIWLLLMRRIHGSGAFGSASDLESGFRQPPPSPASSVDI